MILSVNNLKLNNTVNEKFPNFVSIYYTDASKSGDKSSFGIHIPALSLNLKRKSHKFLQILSVEALAIFNAITLALDLQLNKVVIFSDSLGAIKLIAKSEIYLVSNPLILNIKDLMFNLHLHGIQRFSSHRGLTGNKSADKLVCEAVSLNTLSPLCPVNFANLISSQKREMFINRQNEFTSISQSKG